MFDFSGLCWIGLGCFGSVISCSSCSMLYKGLLQCSTDVFGRISYFQFVFGLFLVVLFRCSCEFSVV